MPRIPQRQYERTKIEGWSFHVNIWWLFTSAIRPLTSVQFSLQITILLGIASGLWVHTHSVLTSSRDTPVKSASQSRTWLALIKRSRINQLDQSTWLHRRPSMNLRGTTWFRYSVWWLWPWQGMACQGQWRNKEEGSWSAHIYCSVQRNTNVMYTRYVNIFETSDVHEINCRWENAVMSRKFAGIIK